MTHATKAIYKFLLSDYVKISTVSIESFLLIKKKKKTKFLLKIYCMMNKTFFTPCIKLR